VAEPTRRKAYEALAQSWLRPGEDPVPALVGGGTGVVAVVATSYTSLKYFHNNDYSGSDRHALPGGLVALGCVLAGLLMFASAWWLARRWVVTVLPLLVLVLAAAWVLAPRSIDVSESFVERPNARWTCTGWSFKSYPAGTQDGSNTTYCVGLEKRISDGP